MIRIAFVVGARPNFMKVAPILSALEVYRDVETHLIHTGQHYDAQLSDVFFHELEIKPPDVYLDVGSGTHGEQTARILERIEPVLGNGFQNGPIDWLVVVGDVNSTMAATLAAAKLQIPVAHVEAGLRSFDRGMPEEVNRIVTDSLSQLLLVSEPAGAVNLRMEGHPENRMEIVGNVMIDTLLRLLPRAKERSTLDELGLFPQSYMVWTLHRPANVDDPTNFGQLLNVMTEVAAELPIVFSVHPRTKARLNDFDLWETLSKVSEVRVLGPLGYLDFLALTSQAKVIVTDSGGLQEESTALGIPCLTMRRSTERPITVDEGTSTLIGSDAGQLQRSLRDVLQGNYKTGRCPALWDGRAAERIARRLVESCGKSLAM